MDIETVCEWIFLVVCFYMGRQLIFLYQDVIDLKKIRREADNMNLLTSDV